MGKLGEFSILLAILLAIVLKSNASLIYLCLHETDYCLITFFTSKDKYFFMLTGEESTRSGLNDDSEIVSLFPRPSCPKPSRFPIENMLSLYGTISAEGPLLCGFSEHEKGCFRFRIRENNWEMTQFTLIENRSHASSVSYGNGAWIITGGQEYQERERVQVLLDTSEILNNSEFINGPKLPMPLSGHCSVKIKEGQVFLAGGYGESHLKDSFIFNIEANASDYLPLMKHGRFGHACGKVRTLFNEIELIAVGGLHQNTMEKYSLMHSKWFALPDIEDQPIFRSATVQGETAFIITGGVELEPHCTNIECRQDTIKLYDNNIKYLVINEKRLSKGRGNHLAIVLPIDFCSIGKNPDLGRITVVFT